MDLDSESTARRIAPPDARLAVGDAHHAGEMSWWSVTETSGLLREA